MKHTTFLPAAMAVIFSVFLAAASPPPNDNFINSTAISGDNISVSGYNNGASIEPGEPVHQPFGSTYKSVWWTFTAPADADYTFEVTSLAFNPLIGVYMGDSLTNLTRASVFKGTFTHIEAQQHAKYHIVVAAGDNGSGGITLKCYQDPLSAKITAMQFATKQYSLYASSKGDILYDPYKAKYYSTYKTNKYGYHINTGEYSEKTSYGLTLITSKGAVILSNSFPGSSSMSFAVHYFDGSYIYMYDHDSKKLIAYKIKKNALQEQGSQVIDNLYTIFIQGSTVIAAYRGIEQASFLTVNGLMAFNRNLKKQVWEEPLARGAFDYFSDSGIYRHVHRGEYAYLLSIHKKGRKQWTSAIQYKNKFLQHRSDGKGNTLYWYYIMNHPDNTNEPITLISRKGNVVLDQVLLPGVGNVWQSSNFQTGHFFVSPPSAGNTYTIYGYKLGNKIKEFDPVTVDYMGSMWMYGKDLSFIQFNTNVYGLTQYDTNLKKIQWKEPMADGKIYNADKDVFLRKREVVVGSTTNLHIKIFDKKGVIAEHVIAK